MYTVESFKDERNKVWYVAEDGIAIWETYRKNGRQEAIKYCKQLNKER